MGAGNRIQWSSLDDDTYFMVGIDVGTFPFALTIHLFLIKWRLQIGFGKAYDE